MLRDRLVCRTKHERTLQRLSSDSSSFTLKATLDSTKSLECAIILAVVIKNSANDVESEAKSIMKVTESERHVTVMVEIIR